MYSPRLGAKLTTEKDSGSSEMDFNTILKYLTGIGLVFFYLMYMPFTLTSAFTSVVGFNPGLTWLYYFSLVLGLLVPLYFGMGKENMMWYFLGLSILLNSVIVIAQVPELAAAGAVTLIVGFLFFLMPILKTKVSNWDFVKNILQLLCGLLLTMGAVLFAWGLNPSFTLDELLLPASFNHMMPQFLFLGGGLTVAWGIVLFLYALFKILKEVGGEKLGVIFEDLIKIFYTFLILIFLIGVTYNVMVFAPQALALSPWLGIVPMGTFPSSIQFFIDFFVSVFLGIGTLIAFLFIFLYILGVSKIAAKNA